MKFSRKVLDIDAAIEADRLAAMIKRQIRQVLRREGAVIGISGGIDSSVTAALCVKALGPERVLGVVMPESDSNPKSESLAEKLAGYLQIQCVVEPITAALEGFGCYRRRDEAIRRMFPQFGDGYRTKITNAANPLERNSLNFFKLNIESPDGSVESKRMPRDEYLQVVAASNFKQRTRTNMLYYHAERLNRAVVGTGNKDEHLAGFFVKYGDGGADLKPISHLFKMQVFQLAGCMDIPEEIRDRTPTTDTYSAEQTQTEFFFGVDFPILDLVWWGMEHEVPTAEIAAELELTEEQVERIMRDIRQKQRTTEYLRMPPLDPDV
jgi:NAD+ synthase